jgi:Flp pilus assembly protein TadG
VRKASSLLNSAIWKAVCAFIDGDEGLSGAALVEFSLFAPMLIAVVIYAMDFGLLFFTQMEVQNAAEAGAHYAIVSNGYDAGKISTAGTSATNFSAVTITSSEFCGCPSAAGTAVTNCSATCNTCSNSICPTSAQGHYVKVTAKPTTTYRSLITYGLISSNYSLTATSTVRVK